MEKKIYAIYEIDYDGAIIKNVTTQGGVQTKMSYSFYEAHASELDLFENIDEWVKKQRDSSGERNVGIIKVNYVDDEVSGKDLTDENIQRAIEVLQKFAKENNPKYKKAREEMKEIEKIKENFKVLGIDLTQEILDREKLAREILES